MPEKGKKQTKPQPTEVHLAKPVNIRFDPGERLGRDKPVAFSLRPAGGQESADQALWVVIRNRVIKWEQYEDFIKTIMCVKDPKLPGSLSSDDKKVLDRRSLPFADIDAYRRLKAGTELFMMSRCAVLSDVYLSKVDPVVITVEEAERLNGTDPSVTNLDGLWKSYLQNSEEKTDPPIQTLPYLAMIRRRLGELPIKDDVEAADRCYGVLRTRLSSPCFLELIWSYWQEEGMLVQTLNAIALRFQNRRGPQSRDPLANFELDPLRPLNNILWGYIQDEQHRLTLARRAYEYDHHYGVSLQGRAVPTLRPADSRSQFIEAFHNLLHVCTTQFYPQVDDMTVNADGFPVLNALKEVHLLLSEGAHNAYGDLPWTARQEMLMQQWIMARPEIREFLAGRTSIAYPEPWMDRVDVMKRMQAWSDVSVMHFRDLAVFGEQILLSIRFGNWNNETKRQRAHNWAVYWRSEIQGYIHAYRAATGVDLTVAPVDATMPAVLLQRRLAEQRRAA